MYACTCMDIYVYINYKIPFQDSKCIRTKVYQYNVQRFPLKKPELLRKWISAVHRADWQPNKNSLICSKHFQCTDYQVMR